MNAFPKVSHFAITNLKSLCTSHPLHRTTEMVSLSGSVLHDMEITLCVKCLYTICQLSKKTVENGDGFDGHMIDLSIVFKKKIHLPRGVGMIISYWIFRFSVTTVATVTDIYWHLLIFRTTDISVTQITDISVYWYLLILLIFLFYWYFTVTDITLLVFYTLAKYICL